MSEHVDAAQNPEAPTPKLPRRRWVRAVRFILIAYGAWCAVLFLGQDWLIFPAGMAGAPQPQTAIPGTTVITLEIENGERVEAWFLPAPGCDSAHPAPVVIFFHGNAELIDYQQDLVGGYHRLGCSVLLPEYRGYGRSGGRPSQPAIGADAVRFYDIVVERGDVDASRIVFHGRSLGGAVAADLATHRTPAGLILQSAFTSMAAMANHFWVPGFLARHSFHTDRVVQSLDVPLLIFHGTSDHVVPVTHGRRLHDLATDSAYIEYPCGHNDLPGLAHSDAYWHAIEKFLAQAIGDRAAPH